LADWVIWGGWVSLSESFAPSLTGIEYWRHLVSVCGYRLISDFIFPKTSFPDFAILSDVASRNMLYLANDQDEPRVPLARSPATAGGVTAVLVGSSAWFGSVFIFLG
jgi:hypothetical protein